jgi:hypothetical protein
MKTQSSPIWSIFILSACVLAASLSIAADTGVYPALATNPALGVYFHALENQLFTPSAKIIPEGGADNHFGCSVSASGDTVAVGAYGDDSNGFNSGAAYIFYRDVGGENHWGQVIKITASDGQIWDHFGGSIAVSGDTLVVGAYENDGKGAAYIFERNAGGIDNWGQVKKITASDGAGDDAFGRSVGISEDTIVVGANGDAANEFAPGAAYIFYRDQGGAGNWGEVKKITASDGEHLDYFGFSVSISGDSVLVGAPYEDEQGQNKGAAYVFDRDLGGADHWGEVKKIMGSDCVGGGADDFGWSVSIDEDMLVVGAAQWGNIVGAAYLFYRHEGGINNWGEVKKLVASDGEPDDCFGWSVSISGDAVVVGANCYWRFLTATGYATIFHRDEGGAGNWGEVTTITPGDGHAGDEFGCSVAVTGDTVFSGAHLNDENGPESGSLYVYSRDQGGAGNWGQVKKIIGRGGAAGDAFGHSASISGDTLVVGAQFDEWGAFTDSGSAYVFYRDEINPDYWHSVKKIGNVALANDDYFGCSVSVGDDIVVAGARGYINNDGGAFIFYRDQGGTDNWGEVKLVRPDEGFGDDYFGCSVSISGDTLVAGAYRDNGNGSLAGAIYVFERNQDGTDNWGKVKLIRPDDGEAYDYFGYAVSISGDTIVAGAYMDDDNGTYSGSAYIFERNAGGSENWGQVKKITPGDGAAYDNFGYSVAISGDTVAVGSPYDDDKGLNSGAAYLFYRDQGGIGNWGEIQKIVAGDGAESDYLGRSVVVGANRLAVGATGDDDNGALSGAVYIFERDQGGTDNWGELQKITASDGDASDFFGRSVSMDGGTLVVGADGDDANGADSGSAYIFAHLPCSDEPVFNSVIVDSCVGERCTSAIAVDAGDPCGGNLAFEWQALDGGIVFGSGADVAFDPPGSSVLPDCNPFRVRVTVTSDASGLSAEETVDITVKLAGDANGDGVVNILDKVEVRNAFGQSGDPGWINADVDCSGVVNILDKVMIRNQFGQTGCACP